MKSAEAGKRELFRWFEKGHDSLDVRRECEVSGAEEVVRFSGIGEEVVEGGRPVVGRAGDDLPAGGADAAQDRAVVADAVVEDDGGFGQGFAAEQSCPRGSRARSRRKPP